MARKLFDIKANILLAIIANLFLSYWSGRRMAKPFLPYFPKMLITFLCNNSF